MSAINGNHPACKAICDALGLKNVRFLQITMAVGVPVIVTAEMYAQEDGMIELPAIVKNFELHEKEASG